MKALLKAMFTHLKTVPAIAWIDEDFGQIDNYEGRPPVKLPCALVSINQDNTSLGSDEYDVANTIIVRVAHNRIGDRPATATDEAVDLTLSKLDDVEDVVTALEGYELNNVCGRLYLKGIITERRADGIAVKMLTFTETH